MNMLGEQIKELREKAKLLRAHAEPADAILANGWEVTFGAMLKNAEETGE